MDERYSLEEQETVITWDRAGDTATIYTFEPRWQKHMEDVLGIQPSKKMKRGYAREYEIPKQWLRLPRKPSEARREAGRLRARKQPVGAAQKSPNR